MTRFSRRREGFLGQVPLEGRSGDAQDLGGLTGTQPLHPGQLKPRNDRARAAQRPPLPLGPLEARLDPFHDARPLELRQRGQDVELKRPGWRGAVDPLAEADERHPDRVQLVEERHEVSQVAPEPIQPPADQDIEPPARGVPDQPIQGRASVLGP